MLSFLEPEDLDDAAQVLGVSDWGGLFNAATIAVALAGSGMIVGVLTRTGAALAFGGVVVQAAQGILIVAMILIFPRWCRFLGTGIPTTAAYVISVTVGAAAMGNLGVSLLAAHLFVFYYAVLSDLTPPDAVTAFAAANIAGADMFATGIEAFRLGITGFLVPFAFVYHQELLLKGSWTEVVIMSGLCRGFGGGAGVVGDRLRPGAGFFGNRVALAVSARGGDDGGANALASDRGPGGCSFCAPLMALLRRSLGWATPRKLPVKRGRRLVTRRLSLQARSASRRPPGS